MLRRICKEVDWLIKMSLSVGALSDFQVPIGRPGTRAKKHRNVKD